MSKRKRSQASSSELLPGRNNTPGTGLSAHVLLVASRDEPTGIADDWFLQRALQNASEVIRSEWVLWNDMPSEWTTRTAHTAGGTGAVPLVRSLWEGRDRRYGTTEALGQFYAEAAVTCPSLQADYALLDWITHKKYLIDLRLAGVPVVPTILLAGDLIDSSAADLTPVDSNNIHEVPRGVSPGDLKRLLERSGWDNAVLKPAVGTRGEGVLRIRLDDWGLSTASNVQRLLSAGDCLLQPYLPNIRCEALCPSDLAADSPVKASTPTSLWGEICVLFVDGVIVHAIHKNPMLWGWHRASCDCSGEGSALQGAECTCDGGATADCVDSSYAPSVCQPLHWPNKTSWAAWRASGNDSHSVVADPMFVDAPHNFTLREGSPALARGFVQIDYASIGPRGL